MAEAQARSLHDDVGAAFDQIESGAPPPVPEPAIESAPPETAEQKDARERDEQGRFKAKEADKSRETLTLKKSPEQAAKAADPAAPSPALEASAAPGAPKPSEEAIAPPAEWKGAGKVQWNKLPKAIQAELRDTYQGLATARAEYEPLQQAIAPHKDIWVRDAGSVENAIGQLAQFYRLYLDNPAGLIQHIARTRGIDLGAAQGQPQPGTPQPQPDINSLIAQTVQQAIAPIQQQFAQTESQQLQSTIDAFAADPQHPYFQDVKTHMGRLLQVGAAKDMQDAYDQATWANPVIRQQLLADQAEATKQTQAAQVAKARQASAVNLNGSPIPGVVASGGGTKGESVLDSVRRVAAELEGA